jgi:hypothetical protein
MAPGLRSIAGMTNLTNLRALVPEDLPRGRADLAAAWRRSFVHDATVAVLSRIKKTDADEIRREIRAARPPTQVGDYPGGSVARLMLLALTSCAARLFELATTVDLAGVASFTFPLATNFADAAFVGEDQPIALRQGVFVGMAIGPVRKLALLAALSSELESASGDIAQAIIGHTLEVAVGRGLDAVLLSANAATADSPAGLLNGATPITATTGGGAAAVVADLRNLVAAIAAANISTASVVFVAAVAQAVAIKLTAGPLFDYRVFGSNMLPAGTVIAIATAGLVAAGDGVPAIDVSKQATLHFADPAADISIPGSPNTISAPVINSFQTDTLALRCIARITWAAAPGSVAVVNGTTW